MATLKPSQRMLSWLLVLACGLLPALAWWAFQRVPTVSPIQAKERLVQVPGTVLLDVRSAVEFAQAHLDAAQNLPLEDLGKLEADRRESLRKVQVLVICHSGLTSLQATRILRSWGIDAVNVEGGHAAWGLGAASCGTSACRLRTPTGTQDASRMKEISSFEQFMAVLAGFGIKPTYMVLSLLVILLLWKARDPGLPAFRWGQIAFLGGELFCAVNYLFFQDASNLSEYLHSYGMALCFGLTSYGAFEWMDHRMVGYSETERRCAFTSLCHGCIKHQKMPCALQRLFLFGSLAAALVSLLPLAAPVETSAYSSHVYGTPVTFAHLGVFQIYEFRVLPLMACFAFLVSALVIGLWERHPVSWGKLFFAVGSGAAGFSFLRLMVYAPFRDRLVWMDAWEEITELLFVAGLAVFLWLFHRGLFPFQKKGKPCASS